MKPCSNNIKQWNEWREQWNENIKHTHTKKEQSEISDVRQGTQKKDIIYIVTAIFIWIRISNHNPEIAH